MTVTQQPAVAVIGASGLQGGAVVEALLAQERFRVVALFRNTQSDAAKALSSKGQVEVRRADLTDPDSLVEVTVSPRLDARRCLGVVCGGSTRHVDSNAACQPTRSKISNVLRSQHNLCPIIWSSTAACRVFMLHRSDRVPGS